MRLPQRKSEQLHQSKQVPEDRYLTASAIKRMKLEVKNLIKQERPTAAAEVRRLAELGDFSENAAYQMAKGQLRRINARITTLEERLKSAIPIDEGSGTSGKIRIGSTVVLSAGGREMTYQVLGSQETNPAKGFISYLSPLGSLLLGHAAGDTVVLKAGGKEVEYKIMEIQ